MIKKYVVLILATVVLQGFLFPRHLAWRLKINGDEFYVQDSPMERRLYRVSSRRQWRLDRKSNAEMEAFRRSLPEGDKVIQDSINDQVMVVTPVEIDIEELLKQINAG